MQVSNNELGGLMKNYKKTLVGLFILSVVSCKWLSRESVEGNPGNAAKNTAIERKLMGEWESLCSRSDLFGARRKEIYKFKGDLFTLLSEFYVGGDDKCTENLMITQTYEGTFAINDTKHGEGEREINFNYTNSYITPQTDGGVDILNSLEFCSIKNKKRKISDRGGSIECPFHRVHQEHFDLFKIEHDSLFLGLSPIADITNLTNKRPSNIDRNIFYKRR
jgi:hypothetical protein